VRLGLVAQASTAVRIVAEATFFAPPGTPLPTLAIDLGDDGLVELAGLTTQTLFSVLPAGSTALRFKALTIGSLPGNTTFNLSVRIQPATTAFAPQMPGCDSATEDTLGAYAAFDGTVSFFAAPLLFDPVVLVLGLTPVGVPLPSAGTMPCILWPAPDMLVPMPYTSPLSTGQPFFELPLPPALRPITFHAQRCG